MAHTLSFDKLHQYVSGSRGVTVPVVLMSGDRTIGLTASIDTGASHCLFERIYGEGLGLDVERGEKIAFRTANSRLDAFGHEIVLLVLDVELVSTVFFFADPEIRKNVLGRTGWLDRVKLGIIDYDQQVYLAPYDTH